MKTENPSPRVVRVCPVCSGVEGPGIEVHVYVWGPDSEGSPELELHRQTEAHRQNLLVASFQALLAELSFLYERIQAHQMESRRAFHEELRKVARTTSTTAAMRNRIAATNMEAVEGLRFIRKLVSETTWREVFTRHEGPAGARYEALVEERRALAKLLPEAARRVEFGSPETWFITNVFHESDYRSQGMGALTYTRAAAELRAFEYSRTSRLARGGEPYFEARAARSADGYTVEVKLARAGESEAVRHLPCPLSLAESVQKCWELGANPRVFYPFLPHRPEYDP